MMPLVAPLVCIILTITRGSTEVDTTGDIVNQATVYSSCNSLEDGLYYLQLTDDGPIVQARCSNDYVIIDINQDSDFTQYFSTFYEYESGMAGPELNDFSTWREWFTPANEDSSFITSYECKVCENNDNVDSQVYHMSNNKFCFWSPDAIECNCDEYQIFCRECVENDDDVSTWTECGTIESLADQETESDHYHCVHRTAFSKPSIGTMGNGCVCYLPTEISTSTMKFIETKNTDSVSINTITDVDSVDSVTVYLTNNDFKDGTYRIQQSGVYILSEDIIFDFNSPSNEIENNDDFSPNDYNQLYWFPKKSQLNKYDGLDTFHGLYTLGFFAGITIETDDVTIDLNGYSLEMSYKFYLQQRFFSIITLANRPFIPWKGATYWGTEESYASNVVIKNGILGRTSHHGIHGNYGENILITDLTIQYFDVAGIGCNGCNNVMISNCLIGPQNQDIPFLGRYTHARSLLPRVKYMVEYYGDQEMTFYGRNPITINELADNLVTSMDSIYNYAVALYNGDNIDDDDIPTDNDLFLFWNQDGLMDASASYGIIFGGAGTAIGTVGRNTYGTSNINIKNIKIYGLATKIIEKVRIWNKDNSSLWDMGGMFRDTLDLISTSNDKFMDEKTTKYVGNVYEDFVFSIAEFEKQNWWLLHIMNVEDGLLNWVKYGENLNLNVGLVCNTDIQLHSTKGSYGIRIDGVNTFNIENIEIWDIHNYGDLGSNRCGKYEVGRSEDFEIQYGYTGTESHGITTVYADGQIKDVKINNIKSNYGLSSGITIYKGCNIQIGGEFTINNIIAGSELKTISELTLPNKIPESCDFDIRTNSNISSIDSNLPSFRSSNIVGYTLCQNTKEYYFSNNDMDIVIKDRNNDNFSKLIFGIVIINIIAWITLIFYKKNKKCKKIQGKVSKRDFTMNETTSLLSNYNNISNGDHVTEIA